MRMDRFTFYNNTRAIVELQNEEQAEKAIELSESNETLGKQVFVTQLRPSHEWGIPNNQFEDELDCKVLNNDVGIDAALQPVLEGRRLLFSVRPPGWADLKAPIKIRNNFNRDVMVRTLEPFGLEAVSRISPNWGDKKQSPRYMCLVDMKTKQAADEAVRKLHDTTVQGLNIWLVQSMMPPWKAYQIGKVDKGKLTMLQEKGLAPPPEEIDEERYSKPFVRKGPRGARG
jgi:hypothetical protein